MKAQTGKTVKPKFTKKAMDTAWRTLAYKEGMGDTTGVSREEARRYVGLSKAGDHEMGQINRQRHREEAEAAKKKLNKKQPGGSTKPVSSDRVKDYEKLGWKKDNIGAVKKGYTEAKDTTNTQWMSKGNELLGIVNKKPSAPKKFQTGGGTAGVRDTYPPASNKSYPIKTPAPAFKKGGAKNPGFKAVQASIAKKSGVSAKAAGAILASATRKASPAAKRANPKLKKVKG